MEIDFPRLPDAVVDLPAGGSSDRRRVRRQLSRRPRLEDFAGPPLEPATAGRQSAGAQRRGDPHLEAQDLADKIKVQTEGRTLIFIDESGLSGPREKPRISKPRSALRVFELVCAVVAQQTIASEHGAGLADLNCWTLRLHSSDRRAPSGLGSILETVEAIRVRARAPTRASPSSVGNTGVCLADTR